MKKMITQETVYLIIYCWILEQQKQIGQQNQGSKTIRKAEKLLENTPE